MTDTHNVQRLGGIGRRLTMPGEQVRPVPVASIEPTPAAEPVQKRDRKAKRSRPARPNPSPRPRAEITTPIHRTTFIAAMMLAIVSGGYSIFGMASIFTGAMFPVIGMGVALEIGKLAAVSWFGANRGGNVLRSALFGLVGVLMCLNAIGAYGFLARAHIGQQLNSELGTMGKQAETTAKLDGVKAQINDLDKQIAQIDDAIAKATSKGQVRGAVDIANAQRKTRDTLGKQRAQAMADFTKLQVEAATVAGEQKLAAADLGPALYLATLMGVDPEAMLRAFILLVAVLLDPAAVLLLMAATSRRRA